MNTVFLVGLITIGLCLCMALYRAYFNADRGFIDRWDATVGWLTALTVYTGKGLFL